MKCNAYTNWYECDIVLTFMCDVTDVCGSHGSMGRYIAYYLCIHLLCNNFPTPTKIQPGNCVLVLLVKLLNLFLLCRNRH